MKSRLPRKKKKKLKSQGFYFGKGIWKQIQTLPYEKTNNFVDSAQGLKDILNII